jgi:hypothetical protein
MSHLIIRAGLKFTLILKPQGIRLLGRPRRRWEDARETGCQVVNST